MNRYIYLEANLWQVGEVVYHSWDLALAAGWREGRDPRQLYYRIENPEWWDKQEDGKD